MEIKKLKIYGTVTVLKYEHEAKYDGYVYF